MIADLIWKNVVAYCLQIGLLVGLAAFIPALLRLRVPRAKLAYWQILLVVCLALPPLQPWHEEIISSTVEISSVLTAVRPAGAAQSRAIPILSVVLGVLAAGAAMRLVWLSVGFLRLWLYRRRSQPCPVAPPWESRAAIRLSNDVASPVTFGFRSPVVLVPAQFPELPACTQHAILCHELLHVQRHDWLFTVAEELVRAVFWFHPAIWWLLGEIQLAREQAVDREVVDMTQARDEYVDALLAIAGAKAQLDLAPAPLFLRRRHLKQRVVSILTEARMPRAILAFAFLAALSTLGLGCWLVTSAFPLSAAPRMVLEPPKTPAALTPPGIVRQPGFPRPAVGGHPQERPQREVPTLQAHLPVAPAPAEIAPERIKVGGNVQQAKLIEQLRPLYPPDAKIARLQGVVKLTAVIGRDGRIQQLEVISGHPMLVASALEAVKTWVYEPTVLNGNPVEVVTQIDVNYTLTQ